jgi:hypothetical protein
VQRRVIAKAQVATKPQHRSHPVSLPVTGIANRSTLMA